ncbi:presequence protease, mitochondrial [Planococcus citri]|uniref:presequence protease, mitochondrial n=1 Tax=Planococcus citri TaxID=170843 RepID=UPI0031F84DED
MYWRASPVLKNLFSLRNLRVDRRFSRTTPLRTCVQMGKTAAVQTDADFKEGSEIEGFRVNRVVKIPDFHCNLIQLDHTGTGAKYVHVQRNDNNNAFSIAFRTTPFDSTGLPHILEHLVLFGSEKYPCRDPFFKMLNRSLATFLNAMTYPDFTMYPFATQNYTDYYNLMSVYLDAVFRPKLRQHDFKLEGWRLEHEDVTDSKSPIIFKGVVFNEMKGVYSDNQNIFMEKVLNFVLPSHTYGVNSGGNPLEIPNLTHDKLVDFHRNHYHPSNARIYSYGNFNLVDRLKFINEQYLQYYDNCPDLGEKTVVPLEPRWKQPTKKNIAGKHDPLATDVEKQSVLGVTYLCNDVRDVHQLFVGKVVSQLMIEGPTSPFYKKLIEPDIGCGYSPGTGYDAHTRDATFSVGLQGIHRNDFEKVEKIIYDTMDECVQQGFDQANVENILHGAELSIKHQSSNFGLNLLFSIAPIWNHDGDIADALNISKHISQFRNDLKNKHYLREVVDQYFKSNNHRLILTMSPDQHYEENIKKQETDLLQAKLSGLSESQLQEIYKIGLELREEQNRKEDLSCLPSLKISDINEDIKKVDLVVPPKVPVQLCTVPTNGVTYFRSLLNTVDVPDDLKSLIPLFAQIISQMGTETYEYGVFDQMVQNKTAGLNFSTHIIDSVDKPGEFEENLILGSHCLDKNTENMFDLWSMLFNESNLTDLNRFSTLVRNIAGDLANDVAGSGHLYATLHAASHVSPSAFRMEQFGGLTYIKKMKEIANNEDLTPTLKKMKKIAAIVLNKNRIRCALNLSPENDRGFGSLEKFLSRVPGDYTNSVKSTLPLNNSFSTYHFVLPFEVNYVAKALPAVPYNHPDFAVLRVLCKLVTTKYLLPLIRERFGAYGAGAKLSSGGCIQFFSYRDPNNTETVDIFDGVGEWVYKNEFSEADIDEAKLGVFRDIDAPTPPSEEGMRWFANGVSDEVFSQHRSRLLNVNRDSLALAAYKYLDPLTIRVSSAVIIGPDSKKTDSWNKVYSE